MPLTMLHGLSDSVGRLLLHRLDGLVAVKGVERFNVAYFEALERILGLPPSTWPRLDEPTLRFWFG